MSSLQILYILLISISCVFSYKVLVYAPLTGHSHIKFMATVANLLQDDGYDVTVLSPLGDKSLREPTPLMAKIKKRIIVETDDRAEAIMANGPTKTRKMLWTMKQGVLDVFKVARNISLARSYMCDAVFKRDDIIEQLKSEKFDLAVSEPMYICGFALFDHLGIKTTISTDSHVGLETIRDAYGEPFTATYVPGLFSSQADLSTIWSRFINVVECLLTAYFSNNIYIDELETISYKYNNSKTWQELLSNTAYSFSNSNPLLDFASPHSDKIISIGGITIDNSNETKRNFSSKFDAILSARQHNVLISFGTTVRSVDMPLEYKKSLLKVFASMPNTTFIWKYEETDDITQTRSNNVVPVPWVPQMDLLADSRLSLFVTHGGLGSTTEVAYSGKPVIIVPIFGDQTRNGAMLARHGGAVVLNREDLEDFGKVRTIIEDMCLNKGYIEKAQHLSLSLINQPSPPRRVFLEHFRFAAKFGKQSALDLNTRNLTFIQVYILDIILIALTSLVLFTLGVIFCYNLVCNHNKKLKTD